MSTAPDRHDALRESIGAYVLGDLSPDLVRPLEEHLDGCADCRIDVARLRPLADRLSAVDASDGLLDVPDAPLPASLDARMSAAFADEAACTNPAAPAPGPRTARRSRRWLPVAAGAAGGAVAAALLTVALLPKETLPEPAPQAAGVAVTEVSTSTGVHAEAWRVNHPWGVEITLRASGLRDGREYDVWVIDDTGHEQSAGAFRGVSKTVTCSVASSVPPAHAARLVVTGPAGKVVISAPIEA